MGRVLAGALGLVLLAACAAAGHDEQAAGGAVEAIDVPAAPQPAAPEEPAPGDGPAPGDEPKVGREPAPTVQEVPYRIEARVGPQEAAEFAATLRSVLADDRGWVRAGFVFVERADAPYTIVLAEGPEVDALCHPYRTRGRFSCQNGPVVALNADRWRYATPQWPADLAGYRTMLINHEVGHLLHLHHPDPQCPGPGLPAPVMAQQSTVLGECLANPWPLQWEVDLAAERREPLAPPHAHDPSDHRPSPPPATS